MSQITTLTFFRYEGFAAKVWAFGMMQYAHQYLAKAKGLSFYKLMGSGKGLGFNPLPDWSTYALLQVWESESKAEEFFSQAPLVSMYEAKSVEMWTLYMGSILARGAWSGGNPFRTYAGQGGQRLAVITRASIRPRKLRTFWKYVPTAQRPISDADGLLYTKGIGEVPILQMATFSVWESEEHLKAYAYGSPEHRKAIALTKEHDWYSEELFARFTILKTEGSWSQIKSSSS